MKKVKLAIVLMIYIDQKPFLQWFQYFEEGLLF